MNKNEFIEVDILRLAKAILKRIWLIILSAIICGGIVLSFTLLFIEPKYEANAMLYVNNNNVSLGGTDFKISSSSLTAAQELVDTYIVILNSRTTINEIIDYAEVDRSYEEVKEMISALPVDSTEIFEVVVTSTNPLEAKTIANAITKVLPDRIADIVDGSSVRIVDYAVMPTVRSSPSYAKVTLLGMIIGVAISLLIIIIIEINDVFIRDENYLTETYDIPVLASIPNVNDSNTYSYKSSYKS